VLTKRHQVRVRVDAYTLFQGFRLDGPKGLLALLEVLFHNPFVFF
jgi:hypothetical protein